MNGILNNRQISTALLGELMFLEVKYQFLRLLIIIICSIIGHVV